MLLNFVRPYLSIRGPVVDGEIADFVVLTGENGSGKSNLLAAIENGSIEIDGFNFGEGPLRRTQVRYFRFGQVLESEQGRKSTALISSRWVERYDAIQAEIQQLPQMDTPEERAAAARARLTGIQLMTEDGIRDLETKAGKSILECSWNDFRKYSTFFPGISDPFGVSIGDIFVSYHVRRMDNRYQRFLVADGLADPDTELSEEEFSSVNGPPPWELMNEILTENGLNYEFDHPEGPKEEIERSGYEPRLTHLVDKSQIRPGELSSGEKTLLGIAMSLFMGSHLQAATAMPKVLLLDESDASLHPSMMKSLLHIAEKIFSERHSVKVIMATHSPTTVALAPLDSLYVMRRTDSPRIVEATRDEALASLLVGLPTLSISNENSRQVFVESEYDQECYQALFTLLRPKLKTPISLDFIASGKGGQGNSIAVMHLVEHLRANGNRVLGILDRDEDVNRSVPEGIAIVRSRYAIENLFLDPLLIAILLVRERIVDVNDVVDAEVAFDAFTQTQEQIAGNFVISMVEPQIEPLLLQNRNDGSTTEIQYFGGKSITVPAYVLNLNGHDWEGYLVKAFSKLQRFQQRLNFSVVDRVLRDAPQWIPRDAANLVDDLLSMH